MDRELVRISKFLSKHLRHAPAALGLTLGPGGWVAVSDLLAACAAHGFPITPEQLRAVVGGNDKQRFAFDPTGTLLRANQGHSVPVDLQLAPVEPPEVLYHGTCEGSVASIRERGLERMRRHHVHLSPDVATAVRVGRRHGRPVVFAVAARQMHEEGQRFYHSANGVWLVDRVPPAFLRQLTAAEVGRASG